MPTEPPLSVAAARPDDVPAIARTVRAVADEGRWIGTPPGTPLPTLEDRYAAAVAAAVERTRSRPDDAVRTLVLRAGDEIVGCADLTRPHPRGPHDLAIAIVADARGRGGGGLLVDALLTAATADPQLHKVRLETWPHNGAAIALYVSRRFVVEGVLHDHWPAPEGCGLWSSVVMGWWPRRAGGQPA